MLFVGIQGFVYIYIYMCGFLTKKNFYNFGEWRMVCNDQRATRVTSII